MLAAGYQVAPDYDKLKENAINAFVHIPKRNSIRMLHNQEILNELYENASQTSSKLNKIARDLIDQDQEQADIKKDEESDVELLEETNQFGFLFTKQKDGSGCQIIKSQSQTITKRKYKKRKGVPKMKNEKETLNHFIKNKKEKANQAKDPPLDEE